MHCPALLPTCSLVYDHAELAPVGLRSPLLPSTAEDGALFKTTLFGPTCDGLDTVARDVPLPRLRNGDWVLFPRFGAYTIAGARWVNCVCGAWLHFRWMQCMCPAVCCCSSHQHVPHCPPLLPTCAARRCRQLQRL